MTNGIMTTVLGRVPETGSGEALRVLVADRSPHFRETLRRVITHHPRCKVVGEAATLLNAARVATNGDPHIVLLDVDLVLNESPARLRRLADAFPHLRIIVMLNEESLQYRRAVAERWGYVCVVKDQAEVDLDRILGSEAVSTPASGGA